MTSDSDRSGILLIDKPEGMTSFSVVSRVRRILGVKKAGHAGTLDPFATGLLTIATGKATRVLRYMENDEKTYLAVMVLGKKTCTGDPEGEPVGGRMPDETELSVLRKDSYGKIRETVQSMIGKIVQVPSSYSAIKINGRPAYDYARKGQEVEIPSRTVTVFSIDILRIWEDPEIRVEMRVHCSKGTYIRTLCEDIGERLGFGAYCASLRRLSCGSCSIDEACTLEEIEKKVMEGDFSFIRGEVTAMQSMPKMEVTLSEASDLRNGKKLDFSAFKDRMGNIDDSEQRVLAVCGDQMIAVVYREVSDGGVLLREERVFA
ncbi:MAG: tRNA pseudouridine(55) synthase TruB [Clostridiales bacterium]|nr:tRNA pseudouridine(55) synthase TruB [Clostridiales bacterium]